MKKTFFGSRVLAIMLTLAMVASFAGVLPLGLTAFADGPSYDGYIYNGDFETGDASNWRLNDSSSVVEGGHNDSGYALRFEGSGSWQYFRQKAYVEPDTDYRVTFWVKRVAGSGAHYIYVTNASNGSETLAAINGTKNWFTSSGDEWEQKKFEFNSGSLSQIEIYFKNSSVADVFLYDDISLAPLPKPTTRGVAAIVVRPGSPSWMPTTKTLPARGSRTTDQPSYVPDGFVMRAMTNHPATSPASQKSSHWNGRS